jgi:Na+/H+ antiporter NhaC
MGKIVRYALLTCTIAYFIAAVLLFIFGFSQTGWSRIDSDTGTFLLSGLTLALSEFQGWGDFWYLAVLVPWVGSSLVLALLMYRFNGGTKRRRLFGGASIAVYYVIMLLVFAIGRLAASWGQIDINPGDVAYLLLLIWPVVGFILGYLSAIIADRIVKFPVSD